MGAFTVPNLTGDLPKAMAGATDTGFLAGQPAETQWRSLRYLNLYRLCLAGLLFVASIGVSSEHSFFLADYARLHVAATAFYLLATVAALMPLDQHRQYFNLQLSLNVLVDVIVLTALIYAGGGIRSGFGALLLVSLAGAGLVGQGRLVLSYAALATLSLLGVEVYRALGAEFDPQLFLQTGLFCAGFFAMAGSARLLAKRVLANEELARQRGVALANQTMIGQRIIEQMQDGVLVVSRRGLVLQHNPRAETLLGVSRPLDVPLADYDPALAEHFESWRSGLGGELEPFFAEGSGLTLRPRFVPTESSERDVLVFLEDMGRVHERARQIKLAALGRLTANIAHEIRNPLSAISHAGELMLEERRGETQERLLRIVRDNTQRLERIVRDVLELGRRDRVHREPIDSAGFLGNFVEEFCYREKIEQDLVSLDASFSAAMLFDRSHLHQVVSNLLGNALRHCRRESGSISLRLVPGENAGSFELHITDDGDGIEASAREHVFEPFFTTHSRGTGLGLYIARELCEANNARLDLLDDAPGAHFRIRGDIAGDSQSF